MVVPRIFTAPSIATDFRVGGKFLYAMQSPQWNEGRAIWSTGVYREIVPLKRIVCTDCFADEKGNVVPATHYGMGTNIPMEMLVTATFEVYEGKMKLTLRHAGLPSDIAGGADQGWNESLDKLAAVLEKAKTKLAVVILSDTEIAMTRVFDAPRKLVWEAYTNPKHIPHWWGLRGAATIVDKMDVRPGGLWRYIQRAPDGTEYAFNGVYREVVPPSRLVSTFEFEPMPGHVSVDTLTFVEQEGKTTMTTHELFQPREDRDGTIVLGPTDLKRMYVGISAAGVFRATDHGATWHHVNQGTCVNFMPDQSPTYSEWGQCVHKVVLNPAEPRRLYQQNHCGVYRSDDGADKWVEITKGLPSDLGFGIAIHPQDADTIWVCTGISGYKHWVPDKAMVVYRSRNQGETWERLIKGLPQKDAYVNVLRDGMAVDALQPAGVYVGTNTGQLYHSADEGDSWQLAQALFPAINSVSAATLS